MQPWYSTEHEAFRREVRALVADHPTPNGFFNESDPKVWPHCLDVYRALGTRGWLSLTWPTELGGLALSPSYEAILWDELAYERSARPPFSAGIVAKAIISAGTAEQHRRFLPPIRRGDLHFALGYSEPEAGSDLTGLRTRASRNGDSYLVTGEKRWTSLGHVADKLWLLCRTGPADSRGRGLTILIVDLDAPGVTVSPIPMMDGGRLNEIHLDGVVVAAENRIGEENAGWSIISRSLAVERHVQFSSRRVARDLEDLMAFVVRVGIDRDPVVRSVLRRLAVDVASVEALSLVVVEAVEKGRDAVAEAAANKLAYTTVCQRIARAAVDFGAPEALTRSTEMEFLWRQSLSESLGGGTSEIMRGIVAQQRFSLS